MPEPDTDVAIRKTEVDTADLHGAGETTPRSASTVATDVPVV